MAVRDNERLDFTLPQGFAAIRSQPPGNRRFPDNVPTSTAIEDIAVPTIPRLTLVLAATCALLVGGCATLPPPAAPPEQPVVPNDTPVVGEAPDEALQTDDARAQYHVMAGEMAAARQQPGQAAREFLEALKYLDDAELARRTATLAVAARDDELSLAAARRWLELDTESADPRELIAGLSLQRGELAPVLEQSLELIRRHPAGLADGFLHVAQVMMQVGQDRADSALSVMQQLVAQWPDLAGAHHALGAVALHFKRLDLAETAVARALSLDPDQREYDLLQIGVWIQQGRIEEADARMSALVAADPKAVDLRLGYARMLLETRQRDAARRQLEAILTLDPNNQDAHYALGVLASNDADHTAAEKHLREVLGGPRGQDAALQLGRIAESLQRHDEALEYYTRVRQGPAALEAVMRSANVLARSGRMGNARRLMDELRDRFPELSTRFDLAEGEMLIENGEAEAALKMYGDALAEDSDNLDLLYGRSLAYERLDRVADAEQDLRSIIEQAPDDARALNALGYMLVVHTDRLAEAEPLIARALELQPDDAAIMDTMGWLQFKQGRTQEALVLLREAHDRFPDPEVAAHLGEVLWVLGEREAAQAVWQAALSRDPDHPVLLETTQRLNP